MCEAVPLTITNRSPSGGWRFCIISLRKTKSRCKKNLLSSFIKHSTYLCSKFTLFDITRNWFILKFIDSLIDSFNSFYKLCCKKSSVHKRIAQWVKALCARDPTSLLGCRWLLGRNCWKAVIRSGLVRLSPSGSQIADIKTLESFYLSIEVLLCTFTSITLHQN